MNGTDLSDSPRSTYEDARDLAILVATNLGGDGAGKTEHVVADKLERLSSAEAELVIQRALKLSDDEKQLDDYGSLDRETLEVVATELGIPLKHLSRALAEQKARTATEGDDTWIERLLRIDGPRWSRLGQRQRGRRTPGTGDLVHLTRGPPSGSGGRQPW